MAQVEQLQRALGAGEAAKRPAVAPDLDLHCPQVGDGHEGVTDAEAGHGIGGAELGLLDVDGEQLAALDHLDVGQVRQFDRFGGAVIVQAANSYVQITVAFSYKDIASVQSPNTSACAVSGALMPTGVQLECPFFAVRHWA